MAEQIWLSNWDSLAPHDKDFMISFMLKPATSLSDIKTQLSTVAPSLHRLSEVQNRLLTAALQSLHRTSTSSLPKLFGGQISLAQLTLDHFGVCFEECPLNAGPPDTKLRISISSVLASYVFAGKTITTKMAWSFEDCLEDVVHYCHDILLVAVPPANEHAWEAGAYVTLLSEDRRKPEFVFPPDTQFRVLAVEDTAIQGRSVVVISLITISSWNQQSSDGVPGVGTLKNIAPDDIGITRDVELLERRVEDARLPHTPGKTRGRKCACCSSP